jgi:3'-phosphoadenosine 5'-phosphosulfate sulfotransferase (PAPS reductase)/FAD synthetase
VKAVRVRIIHSFFSGGRDSALSSFIAYRVAKARGWGFKLIFVDTTIAIPDTIDYVHKYAEWLGAELVTLKPRHGFNELAPKYSWPLLYHNRWCYYALKREPTVEYLQRNYRGSDVVVMGIRGSESLFRLMNYDRVFTWKCYGNDLCVHAWYPILRLSDIGIEQLNRRFNIPENPVWRRVGSSGDCLCLAGTTERKLIRIAINYPNSMRRLVEIDEKIQVHRRSREPSYPAPLLRRRLTLSEWYSKIAKQTTIDDYLTEYNSCQLGCMLE